MFGEGQYYLKSDDICITPSDEAKLWDEEWIITSKKNDNVQIGVVSFAGEKVMGSVPITISIEDRYHDQGYGTEALKMMVNWAFLHRNVYELTAEIDHENSRAIAAFEKAGFIYRDDNHLNKIEHYSITKQKTSWTGLYVFIGIVVGLTLGVVLNSPWIGLGIGLVLSLLIGAIMDNNENKDREKIVGKKDK